MMIDLRYGYLLVRRTLLLAGMLAVACCALQAQNDSQPAGPMRGRGGPERELPQLTQVLSLTADQQTQVKGLLAERWQKIQALNRPAASTEATGQATPPTREQMEAIRNDTDAKIAALLNDDQKAKFAAWQQQRKERMERRGAGGEGGPPPQPPNS